MLSGDYFCETPRENERTGIKKRSRKGAEDTDEYDGTSLSLSLFSGWIYFFIYRWRDALAVRETAGEEEIIFCGRAEVIRHLRYRWNEGFAMYAVIIYFFFLSCADYAL